MKRERDEKIKPTDLYVNKLRELEGKNEPILSPEILTAICNKLDLSITLSGNANVREQFYYPEECVIRFNLLCLSHIEVFVVSSPQDPSFQNQWKVFLQFDG
jgi:hypothetical protein